VLVVTGLLAAGALRMAWEPALTRTLREQHLVAPQLETDTRERIGQTSAIVALGGLRTLVATFLNLRAHTRFTEQRWSEVAMIFDTITDLAPRTRYYWETGSWHQAYNAASDYLNDSKLPPLRRREAWRSSVQAGRAFLERGIRNNPDDWRLHAALGFLLTDPNKFPAFRDVGASFAAAADAYHKAAEHPDALGYVRRSMLYALARVDDRQDEALALARSLHAEGARNRTPTLLCLLLVLEARADPGLDTGQRAVELFGSDRRAYDALCNHWRRTRERFPVDGVAAALQSLELKLGIPETESILKAPLPAPFDPDQAFGI
jgi:hypothetical protein